MNSATKDYFKKPTYPMNELVEAFHIARRGHSWTGKPHVAPLMKYCIAAGLVELDQGGNVHWTTKGSEVVREYMFRPLKNNMTAVFIETSHMGDPLFKIYNSKVEKTTDIIKKRDTLIDPTTVFIEKDNILYMTKDKKTPDRKVPDDMQFVFTNYRDNYPFICSSFSEDMTFQEQKEHIEKVSSMKF